MKRLEYMTRLRQNLVEGGLSNEEINDALEFYEELFLDGGIENEEKTAHNLGDPETLAQQILAENGAVGFLKPEHKMEDVIDNRNGQQTPPPQTDYDIAPDNRKKALLIILIVTAVAWVPALFGLMIGAVGVFIGLFAAMIGIGATGVALAVSGAVTFISAPPVGLALFGAGLFLIGLIALIAVPLVRWLAGLVKKAAGLLKKGFDKLTGTKAVTANG